MKTNEEKILGTQTQQLFEELEKIDFIRSNADEIKKRLVAKMTEANNRYFKEEVPRNPGNIFRGIDFQNAINQSISQIHQEQGTQAWNKKMKLTEEKPKKLTPKEVLEKVGLTKEQVGKEAVMASVSSIVKKAQKTLGVSLSSWKTSDKLKKAMSRSYFAIWRLIASNRVSDLLCTS